MKTFKFIGQLIGNYEWTVQVSDDEDQDDAYMKLVEKGLTHENPVGEVTRNFIDWEGYDEDTMECVWSSELEEKADEN